jgi:hypothetical protein
MQLQRSGWLVKGGDVFSDDEPTSSIPQSPGSTFLLLPTY